VSRIVLMGSGETAPAMVKTHRAVLAASGDGPAVMLDTPYGFQVNADDLTHRTLKYFHESVGQKVSAAQWRTRHLSTAEREQVLTELSRATWLFAGPGSPTYALDQWHGTPIVGAIGDVVDRGGAVVLGSAAAVTAGRWALPVYEIYKVGAEPHWVPGLDLLKRFLDLSVAVIPHYDNAEGGTYDTRFCYLGSGRLERLEADLPPEAAILGVDEHTAVIVDLTAGSVQVSGVGRLGSHRFHRSTQMWRASALSSTLRCRPVTSTPPSRPSCPSTMRWPLGPPTRCRATHSTADVASSAPWSSDSASLLAHGLPIPPRHSHR
jgi:cyanophycinase-like exopeptidase